ncbi:hypothetical protein [Methanocella sp. MCL-LM]|uniref:hypothetical protein n=1 Tax=Methanocella sp. MCL-LM TaxID=3412035 RepID=UPI003C75CCB1
MSNEEMILSTIKKVYAIRASIEKRTEEHLAGSLPVIGYMLVGLAGTSLSKDQVKDVSAFITATCTTPERLAAMDTISAFKAKNRVHRPIMVWLSYACLFLPLVLVVAAEAYMYYQGLFTQLTYLAVALLLVFVALLAGLALFSVLSYDPEYRREMIEHKLWKHMNVECQKRKKQQLHLQKKSGQPSLPAEAAPAVANNK